MKNKKWFTYTLSVVLALIALAAVGLTAFRIGLTQSAAFIRMGHDNRLAPGQDEKGPMVQGTNPGENSNGDSQGNFRDHDFGDRDHQRGRGHMFGGLFSLIHIAILALLLWFGYKFVQKSGWRLVRVQTDRSATSEPVSAEVEEKKESE